MLQTPEATVSPTSQPLPLTKGNLKLLSKMSSAPTTPSPKKRKAASGKSTSGETTGTSQGTPRSTAASEAEVRERLKLYRITIAHEYYSTVPRLNNLVKGIAVTTRGSPGLSSEKITILQRDLNKMATSKEDTAASNLISQLFTTPDARDATAPLHRLHNCLFIETCIPMPPTAENPLLAKALRETQLPNTPKPDFTFGIHPESNAFTQSENDANALEAVRQTASIVSGLQYPFFAVEWKSSFASGTHSNAASQCARSGAAIVSSMVKLYREAFPFISGIELLAKTLSFSSSVDSYSVIIYVHSWEFRDGEDSWHMHIVTSLSFLDNEPGRFRDFRRVIDNIMDWGLGTRSRSSRLFGQSGMRPSERHKSRRVRGSKELLEERLLLPLDSLLRKLTSYLYISTLSPSYFSTQRHIPLLSTQRSHLISTPSDDFTAATQTHPYTKSPTPFVSSPRHRDRRTRNMKPTT